METCGIDKLLIATEAGRRSLGRSTLYHGISVDAALRKLSAIETNLKDLDDSLSERTKYVAVVPTDVPANDPMQFPHLLRTRIDPSLQRKIDMAENVASATIHDMTAKYNEQHKSVEDMIQEDNEDIPIEVRTSIDQAVDVHNQCIESTLKRFRQIQKLIETSGALSG